MIYRVAGNGYHAGQLGKTLACDCPQVRFVVSSGFENAQATENLSRLAEVELDQFAQVLDMENPDLYKMLTGQSTIPAEISNPLLHMVCSDLRDCMAPKISVPSTASFEGKVWE